MFKIYASFFCVCKNTAVCVGHSQRSQYRKNANGPSPDDKSNPNTSQQSFVRGRGKATTMWAAI